MIGIGTPRSQSRIGMRTSSYVVVAASTAARQINYRSSFQIHNGLRRVIGVCGSRLWRPSCPDVCLPEGWRSCLRCEPLEHVSSSGPPQAGNAVLLPRPLSRRG